MPANVAIAYPRFPTIRLGATRLFQSFDLASAAAVAGPPIAADDATSKR